ncbi:hypothetical protein [Rhizobium sp. SSA_523]|uniref:hypothetical protein n=1 Tax=Rhizobium sp. SSA_523 TaxID=2952477 RepID=UPI0020911BF1|nr:hypothetical protein [Rhizobium sp. SSA_523]MCO5734124.1 hypothetical protein [Rhizobium sp. SSA_523]WKC24761.1 hypothetical protein QTJ18_12095 [Rhizobium sp. SSA_523]
MPIAANVRDLQTIVTTGLDQRFAERVRHLPMAKSEPDDSRESVEFSAILRVGGGQETNLGSRSGSAWRTSLAAGKAELHVDHRAWPQVKATAGDLIVALERVGEPMFEVLRVDDRGETRLVLELGEA